MGLFGIKFPKEKKREALASEAQAWLGEVRSRGTLTSVPTDFLLDKDENAYYDAPTELRETRAVRHYNAGHAGIRIMKGIYIGRTVGTSESNQEWRTLDRGQLLITNTRVIFKGSKENRIILLDKVILVKPYIDGIEISLENKNKSIVFTARNPLILKSMVELIKGSVQQIKVEINQINL